MAGYGLWMAPTRSRGRERGGDGEVVGMVMRGKNEGGTLVTRVQVAQPCSP